MQKTLMGGWRVRKGGSREGAEKRWVSFLDPTRRLYTQNTDSFLFPPESTQVVGATMGAGVKGRPAEPV